MADGAPVKLILAKKEFDYENLENNAEDNVTDYDRNHLRMLDREIEKKFEMMFKKRNKNDDMIKNKIQIINQKPLLRDYLFKMVGEQQLEKDIEKEKKLL